ncbi:MAG: hypothetical protein JSV47_01320 [Deltaproteobacteria bacterium]|nr:MAG: hypothetical protein JSV47_01320 [Deltaproteobacteria bacterium]
MLIRLIEMIEKNAESMAEDLKNKLLSDPTISSYQTLDDKTFYENIFEVYSRLGHWLLRDTEKGEVRTHYSNIGAQRFEEGFPLHELVQALVATKRHIWDTVLEKGIMQTAKELDSAVDFITYLNRFFDMAIYYTTLGYYGALNFKSTS